MTAFTLSTVPGEFHWLFQPSEWNVEAGNRLTITAGEKTNWFTDPSGNFSKDNAPGAIFVPPDTNFLLSAKVSVDFTSPFDAGVIQVRERDDLWAKLCFEYSPQLQPMIVSVVTREISDDCNSVVIEGHEVYLRLAVSDRTMAFHYSRDGRYWHFVRYFTLGNLNNLRVGFSSQSPTGRKCTSVFSDIKYWPGVLKDIRSGE